MQAEVSNKKLKLILHKKSKKEKAEHNSILVYSILKWNFPKKLMLSFPKSILLEFGRFDILDQVTFFLTVLINFLFKCFFFNLSCKRRIRYRGSSMF